MPAVRERISQDDFSEGMSRDVAPQLISQSGVYDLVNGLLDEDGNPYRRGGTVYHSKTGLGEKGLTFVWDGYLKPGRRVFLANDSDYGVLDSAKEPVNLGGAGLNAPKQSAVVEDLLFVGDVIYGGSRKSAAYSTGSVKVTNGSKTVTGSGTAWEANVDAGMLLRIGPERVYVVESVASDTSLTLRDAYQGATGEGKGYALRPLHSISEGDPYSTFEYKTTCAGRLVVAEGKTVKFSEVNNPHSYTNSNGTANEHPLPGETWIVGLASAGQSVLIFTTAGVWVLDGLPLSIVDLNGNPQHRLQILSTEIVLAGACGLAGSGQQIVVPAVDGIYLMDGVSSPERISRPIERLYRRRIASGYQPGGAVVYKGHYFLPILRGTSEVSDLLVCRLDRPARSRRQTVYPWSRFDGDGGEVRCFSVHSDSDAREPELLGAQASDPSRVVRCSSYFEPEAVHAKDADGSVHNFQLITRDIETGGETMNVIRALRLRYELVRAFAGEGVLQVSYGDGSLELGGAIWGEVDWGEFDWAPDDEGAVFNALVANGDESDGREVERFRINARQRFGRFRIATSGPVASFALRLLEMDVRPSGAVRR